MVQIRKKNIYFVTNLLFGSLGKSPFGALGFESPHGGAMRLVLCPSVCPVVHPVVVVRPLSVRPRPSRRLRLPYVPSSSNSYLHDVAYLDVYVIIGNMNNNTYIRATIRRKHI